MKETWKRLLTAALSVVIAAGIILAPAVNTAAPDVKEQTVAAETLSTKSSKAKSSRLSIASKSKTLRVLLVGNSFSVDSSEYLYEVIQAAGYKAVVGNLQKTATSLDMQWNYIKNDKAVYTYRRKSADTSGKWEKVSNATWSTAMEDEAWDVVFFQQQSTTAGRSKTYHDYMTSIAKKLEQDCKNTKVKVGWQMTWALTSDTTDSDFDKYFNGDELTMYQAICAATQEKIDTNDYVDVVARTGTAVQNARTSYTGDTLDRDGKHLSKGMGRWLAAMSIASACGVDLSGLKHISGTAEVVSDLNLQMLKSSVAHSESAPYEITNETTSCPTLTKPTLKVSTKSGGRVISWKPVTGATSYVLQRKLETESEYTTIRTIENSASIPKSYSYEDTVKNNKVYVYRLTVKGDSYVANTAVTSAATCYITKPSITSVSNVKGQKIQIKWKTNSAVTGYQVQTSRSNKFPAGNRQTATLTGSSVNSKTTSKRTKGKKYYVRVRSYIKLNGKVYYSSWSSLKNVTIKK